MTFIVRAKSHYNLEDLVVFEYISVSGTITNIDNKPFRQFSGLGLRLGLRLGLGLGLAFGFRIRVTVWV